MKYEIWLGEHCSYYDHGVAHLDDGSNKDLAAWEHTAMFGFGVVLIDEYDKYLNMNFPVRWRAEENGLLLRYWGPEVERIILHNDTGNDLTVDCCGTLSAGETREFRRETCMVADKSMPKITPIYDSPGNLQRKMAMMARHIADIKNTMDCYGWIFAKDPWLVQRLQEAEAIYAELETALKESLKDLEPAEAVSDEKN